jgi:hypothetical protein
MTGEALFDHFLRTDLSPAAYAESARFAPLSSEQSRQIENLLHRRGEAPVRELSG